MRPRVMTLSRITMTEIIGLPLPERVDRIEPCHLVEGLLNVVVFGPGRGEASLVRLPDGQIGIVDGCGEPDPGAADGRGDPMRELLNALEENGGGPEPFRLAFVCLTHPHDDHYGGLGRLLARYRRRIDRICTVPLCNDRWREALMHWVSTLSSKDEPSDRLRQGLDRFLTEFQDALRDDVSITLLTAGTRLPISAGSHQVSITACGPSGADVMHSQNALSKFEGALRASAKFDPNRVSAALTLRWDRAGVLLAGDLVNEGECNNRGWFEACNYIDHEIQVVNAAHHASAEAHHDPLWQRLKPKLVIVTPFKKAERGQPPRPEMINLLAADATVAITSPPLWAALSGGPPVARNPALVVAAPPKYADRKNAVAVALDRDGTIRRLVLAGKADLYRPASP